MPQKCKTCQHPDIETINEKIISGESKRDISRQFNLTASSVHRHAVNHLPKTLLKSKRAKEITHADNLIAKIIAVETQLWTVIKKLDKVHDFGGVIRGLSELRKTIETSVRISSLNQSSGQKNILNDPEWVKMIAFVLGVLEPFPEAWKALRLALEEYDDIS